MQRNVSTQKLKIGMYVSNLDSPWLDTPFLLQGFLITDDDDIETLQQYCKYIYIDIDQGVEADIYLDDLSEPNEKDLAKFLEIGERQVEYEDQITTLEEYPEAEATLVEASLQVANIMDSAKKGDNLDILAIKGTVQPMLDSIIKNVDALLWMLKLKDGQQTYQQAIENSVLAMAFGRHLGLNMSDIRNLALGMLLLDVGKLRTPRQFSTRPICSPGRSSRWSNNTSTRASKC